jgi:hypothetical protein
MNVIAKTLLTITLLAALPGATFAKDHKKTPAGVKVRWKEVPAVVQTAIPNGAAFYCTEVKGTDRKWTKVYVTDAGALIKVEPDNARNKRKHKPLFGMESGPRSASFA